MVWMENRFDGRFNKMELVRKRINKNKLILNNEILILWIMFNPFF